MKTYQFLSKQDIELLKKAKEEKKFNENVQNLAAHIQKCLTEEKSLFLHPYYEKYLTKELIQSLKEAKWEIVEKKEVTGKDFIYEEMYYLAGLLAYPKNEENYILITFKSCE